MMSKTQLLWMFPPAHLSNRAIQIAIDNQLPAYILVEWEGHCPPWVAKCIDSGATLHKFNRSYETNIFKLQIVFDKFSINFKVY